jgi:hypothetical protein
MTKDEALRLALEALGWYDRETHEKAISAIKQALEQPEPEPVAVWELQETGWETICDADWLMTLPVGTRLYTTPPKREPLTDDEICRIGAQVHGFLLCNEGQWGIEMARAIEAAHGIGEKK